MAVFQAILVFLSFFIQVLFHDFSSNPDFFYILFLFRVFSNHGFFDEFRQFFYFLRFFNFFIVVFILLLDHVQVLTFFLFPIEVFSISHYQIKIYLIIFYQTTNRCFYLVKKLSLIFIFSYVLYLIPINDLFPFVFFLLAIKLFFFRVFVFQALPIVSFRFL